MTQCFFVSDLHGSQHRYAALFSRVVEEQPQAVFLGGDLLPAYSGGMSQDFITGFLAREFSRIRDALGDCYPRVFLILGNDDSLDAEERLISLMEDSSLWVYLHNRVVEFGPFTALGYAFVPPTPFLNKDWERYDVSRYVDPGCVPPEEGWRSSDVPLHTIEHATIKADLKELVGERDLSNAVFLFHAPPYQTNLDRAGLDGVMVDHVPLDLHVGSIAIKEFILSRQPLITLHGHIHESPRLTGSWQDRLQRTFAFSAAHDGPELALIRFSLEDPGKATRELC
jgi:Icc-related predicted phosphoesterase